MGQSSGLCGSCRCGRTPWASGWSLRGLGIGGVALGGFVYLRSGHLSSFGCLRWHAPQIGMVHAPSSVPCARHWWHEHECRSAPQAHSSTYRTDPAQPYGPRDLAGLWVWLMAAPPRHEPLARRHRRGADRCKNLACTRLPRTRSTGTRHRSHGSEHRRRCNARRRACIRLSRA